MLTSLQPSSWKSFGENHPRTEIPLGPVTLLVGPNGSGKTNVLDALRVLHGLALDLPVGDALRVRGHTTEAARAGTKRFRLTTQWTFGDYRVGHQVAVATEPNAAIRAEMMFDREASLFTTRSRAATNKRSLAEGADLRVNVRSPGGDDRSALPFTSARSLLGQIAASEQLDPFVIERARDVRRALREVVFLEIEPERMRDYQPQNGSQLSMSGENVSPVLETIGRETPALLETIVDWVEELSTPSIDRVELDVTQHGVMFFFVEKNGHRVSARSVSDGTLRFLGQLVALLTATPGTIIVMEEPDAGVHPSRVCLLAELLEAAASRGVQVVATTHSPTLLAHLSEQSLSDVVAFGRDRADDTTVCSRLGDLDAFSTLRGASNFEHLISTGWLEHAM